METAVEQGGLPLTSLAARFGGGLVARLAASKVKALQSRQASAEPSTAAASHEASAPTCSDAAPAAVPDDEALLLSGLLNTADATARPGQGLLGRLQPRPALEPAAAEPSRGSSLNDGAASYSAEVSELLPEASGGAGSLASLDSSQEASGSGNTQGHEPTQPLPLQGEDEPSADGIAAMGERSRQQRDSFQDAADDAVLTGSPQASIVTSSRADRRWPAALGRPLEGAELERATGAYSEERFQTHLARLQQALAPHRQRRQQEAEAAAAGVDDLVARVRQLGTGVPSTAVPSTAAGAVDDKAEPMAASAQVAVEAAPQQVAMESATQQVALSMTTQPGWEDQVAHLPAEQPRPGGIATSVPPDGLPRSPTEGGLLHSPTERLLGCRQRLQQRPLTAPGMGSKSPGSQAAQQRPVTGSPAKVKSLMQVKGEQDAALKRLQEQPRPFRASPLPLSTMEPRYQQQEEQREARRQAAHEQRRQQLLEQQQPFGFEERAAERAQRRQLLHGGGPGFPLAAAGSGRPCTPPFHAQPVPVATTEARYALLAAELQLQQRSWRRPATAAAATAAVRPASPDRRPATAAARWHAPSRIGRGYRAQPADVADAMRTMVTLTQQSACAAGQAAFAEQPGPAAGAAAKEPAGVAPAGSLATTVEEEGSSTASASGVQPAEKFEAGEPQYSEQWEAEASGAMNEPSNYCPQPDAQTGEGSASRGLAQQAPAAEAAPGCTAQQPDGEAAGQSSGSSLAPFAECAEPAMTTAAAAGMEASGPGPSSCPVVQRLGSRGSSFTGEHDSPEAGIAVPVACSGLGAAVGAELLAAGSLRASLATDTWNNMSVPATAAMAAAAGGGRRDTPPQHIAARHQQVAAAARREVEAALARRGLRLDGL